MLFFKLWIFEIDFMTFILFLMGIFIGLTLAVILYLLFVLASLKKGKHIVKTDVIVNDEEIIEMINNAQMTFKDKKLRGDQGMIGYTKNIITPLCTDIAQKFFPESKRPIFELSIDEVLMLAHYISKRIDELLDRPGLRIFKRIKVSTLIGLGDVKKSIDHSALFKATKKYKVKEIFSAVKGALNIVNPLYWARRLIVNSSMNYAIYRLCSMIIAIAGEETYKIYSKRVFNEEKEIDSGVDALARTLDAEFKNMENSDLDDILETNEEHIVKGVKKNEKR